MAKIIPIDVIKGISGKYGSKTNDYFSTNKSSNKVHLSKLANPYQGPATERQLEQQQRFAVRQAAASAWLRANRPTDTAAAPGTRAHDGTDLYRKALQLKRAMGLSSINQVIHKYMADDGTISLPGMEDYNHGGVIEGGDFNGQNGGTQTGGQTSGGQTSGSQTSGGQTSGSQSGGSQTPTRGDGAGDDGME